MHLVSASSCNRFIEVLEVPEVRLHRENCLSDGEFCYSLHFFQSWNQIGVIEIVRNIRIDALTSSGHNVFL